MPYFSHLALAGNGASAYAGSGSLPPDTECHRNERQIGSMRGKHSRIARFPKYFEVARTQRYFDPAASIESHLVRRIRRDDLIHSDCGGIAKSEKRVAVERIYQCRLGE